MMSWFQVSKDYFRGLCASEDCLGVVEWRLEAGGVGSDYCGNCKEKICKISALGELARLGQKYDQV